MGYVKAIYLAVALLTGLLFNPAASAATLLWTLGGVQFNDGGTASGSFSTDSVSGNVLSYDITTVAGTNVNFSTFHYDDIGDSLFFQNVFGPNSFDIGSDSPFAIPLLHLAFANPLTSAGINNLVLSGFSSSECNNACDPPEQTRIITAGFATANPVPLPAAVWLLGSSLLGIFGVMRRKSLPA